MANNDAAATVYIILIPLDEGWSQFLLKPDRQRLSFGFFFQPETALPAVYFESDEQRQHLRSYYLRHFSPLDEKRQCHSQTLLNNRRNIGGFFYNLHTIEI